MSLALALYRLGTGLFEPFAPLVLGARAGKGKEDPARMGERLGRASLPRPEGQLVWLHGVSVGETISLLTLIDRIRAERPGLSILVTSGTVTSAELLAKRLPAGVIHQYIPVDGPHAVARFMAHWKPDLAMLCESDLWPNLISAADASGAKLALVSARLTESSAKGWAKRPAAARDLLGRFDLILPQDEETVSRLKTFGMNPGPILNLKLLAAALPCDESELKRLKAVLKGRRIVVAASTHPGEEEIIATAVPPGPILIVIPRHPQRGDSVASTLAFSCGRAVERRAAGAPLDKNADVYVADTLGEMGLFLRLGDLVVLCGSFVPDIGGHNPLEPARLGTPTISGPFVHKNAELFATMGAVGAVEIVEPASLGARVSALLADRTAHDKLAKAGQAFADTQGTAFEEGWALITRLLP